MSLAGLGLPTRSHLRTMIALDCATTSCACRIQVVSSRAGELLGNSSPGQPGVLRGDQFPSTVARDIDVEKSKQHIEAFALGVAAQPAHSGHQADLAKNPHRQVGHDELVEADVPP